MSDLLRRLGDLLLPGGDDVQYGAALTADPRIEAATRRALDVLAAAPDDLEQGLAALAAGDPPAREALALVVTAAHYADPRVREALGYDGPRSLPLPEHHPDADLSPLLARVRTRGPRYRAIPPS
jgi:hypothetical protein